MFSPGAYSESFGLNGYGVRKQDRQRVPHRAASGGFGRMLAAWLRRRKVLQRHAVLAVLYALVGISVISTVSVWSVVTSGAERGSLLTVDKRASILQAQDFFPANATGERRLHQLKSVAGRLGDDVADLFAIRPAGGNGSLVQEKEADESKGDTNRPCQAKTVCPELEIPDLIEKRALKLSGDLTINQSEGFVFGKQQDQALRLAEEGNRQMLELVTKARRYNVSVRTPLADSLSSLAMRVGNYTYLPGGHWRPTACLPRWKVAIIFPYRNRSYHLPIVLRYLTPMLQRQLLEFAFYTVNQENNLAFNRAMLMNVGFVEALNFSRWDCFIFHDVDHVPLSDFNYYGCSGMPRHFISGSDRWKYKLPYANFFGAVTGFTFNNILKINGFPNVYWGWGGEDDEIWERVKEVGLPVSRAYGPYGYYDVITHHHNSAPQLKERMQLLKSFKPRFRLDGLSNLKYKKPRFELHALYTNISVDIQKLHIHVPRVINTKKSQLAEHAHDKAAVAAKAVMAKGHVNMAKGHVNKPVPVVRKELAASKQVEKSGPNPADSKSPVDAKAESAVNVNAEAKERNDLIRESTAVKKPDQAPAKPPS